MPDIRLPQSMLRRRPMTMDGAGIQARAAAVPFLTQPSHDPPLAPRDEAVFLLTAAAEVEHALMVPYLFAGYSLRVKDA